MTEPNLCNFGRNSEHFVYQQVICTQTIHYCFRIWRFTPMRKPLQIKRKTPEPKYPIVEKECLSHKVGHKSPWQQRILLHWLRQVLNPSPTQSLKLRALKISACSLLDYLTPVLLLNPSLLTREYHL